MASEDQLRQEAFSLAQEVSTSLQEAAVAGATSAQLAELVARAERLVEIRARLQYKLVHQLDTLEMVFSLAMMAEDWEKVTVISSRYFMQPLFFILCSFSVFYSTFRQKTQRVRARDCQRSDITKVVK